MSKIKILFFTNNLNRTGAEVVLFNHISRLDPNQFEIGLVLTHNQGELVSELPKHIKCFSIKNNYSLLDKVRNQLGSDILFNQISQIQKDHNYSIWYANTLNTAFILKYAAVFQVKTIVHIHELASNYSYISKDVFSIILKSNMIIACSQLVYEEVNRVYAGTLKIIKSTIDTDYLNNIIYENKLNSNSFDEEVTFVCSGSISDRKGTDLFIQIANYFRNSNYKFLWLGKFSNTGYSEWITDWLINLQLPNIKFVSPSSQVEYYSLMKNSNIYLSTSREESLGLSIMEALYLKKPVIALNSGGSKLMIDQTNGIVIDSFEIDNIASQINIFLKSKLQKIDFSNSKKFFADYNLENEFSLWQDLLIQLTL